MHPLKNILRLSSFLPLTRPRPWKGKSIALSLEIDPCSAHCRDEYHLPVTTSPVPLPLQPEFNPEAIITIDKVGDDNPSLFSASDSNCDSVSDMAVNSPDLDLDLHVAASGSRATGLVRVVSWASILSHRCRWNRRQERDLAIAKRELARCQKAWSSEQEVWLVYIKALTEEKEAHEGFLHQRAKQQGDEQLYFRRSWDRRRSSDGQQRRRSFSSPSRRESGLRRRLRRQGTT